MTNEKLVNLYRHLFEDAQAETGKAVELMRRCLSKAVMTSDICKDMEKFVREWDEAGEPFPVKQSKERQERNDTGYRKHGKSFWSVA